MNALSTSSLDLNDLVSEGENRGINKLKKDTKKIRLQIVLGENSVKRLDKLQEYVEPNTRTEVFRVALRVLENVIEELENGNQFLLRDKAGNIRPYPFQLG
jgi:hypothetical protein